MDPSVGQLDDGSESPTQVNDDRSSYDRYKDPASLPSTDLCDTQEQFSDDFLAQSLNENESGAVNFDTLYSGGPDVDSPVAPESQGGRRRTNGMARFFPNSDNDVVPPAAGLGPETPTAPKNPFAGKFQTPLVAGSQLFAQTPFSGAGFGQASPTSSRPSPSDLPVQTATTPYGGGSSLLRPRFPNSMLGEQTTPMPMPMFHNLATSSQSRPEAVTPYHGEPAAAAAAAADDADVTDANLQPSSPTVQRRRPPAPIEEYEPMQKSQERRAAALALLPRRSSFDMSSDDEAEDTASRRRRDIVHRKKKEATRILSGISTSGPTFRDDIVEVPASTRKDEHPQSRSRGETSSLEALGVCPESDPQEAVAEPTPTAASAAAAAKPPVGPRSSAAESEYGTLSFPQSLIDASYGAKTLSATKTPSSSAVSLPEITTAARRLDRGSLPLRSSLNEAEAIPETSPVRIRPSATNQSPIQITSDTAESPSRPLSAGLELLSSQPQSEPPPSPTRARQSQGSKANEVPDMSKHKARKIADAAPHAATSSPPVPIPDPCDQRTRRRLRDADDDGGDMGKDRLSRDASTSSAARSAVSSLSSLSVTPTQVSRAGTPITANDSDRSAQASDQKTDAPPKAPTTILGIDVIDIGDDSPLLPRRRRRHDRPSLPALKLGTGAPARATASAVSLKRGRSPLLSGSTDELAVSPASVITAPGPERRTRSTRKFTRSASARTMALASTSHHHRRESAAPGLFAGMLFSVTFQSKRKGESEADFSKREKQGEKLQAMILDEGGSILPDGFDALFQPPPITTHLVSAATSSSSNNKEELCLLPQAAETGFTALISDGHSRKVKYMQALALGLPCLAPRWVTTCLERHSLVDWSPYLLCAGESSFLGGAIRSRNLAAYDAATAQLVDIVQTRSKLLQGLRILVLLRRSTTRDADVYVFLAHVLGASLTRAHSTQEARECLRAMEDTGRPFDWVYTNDETEIKSLFHSQQQQQQERAARPAAKKRKRPSTTLTSASAAAAASSDRPPAPVKILSDERFIQSLIFGRLIEEDDLGG